VSDLFRVEQEHDSSGGHRGNGADRAKPQHHRPKIRGPGRRLWNKFGLQRTLMPGPIVTETPAFQIVLRPLLNSCSGEQAPREQMTRDQFRAALRQSQKAPAHRRYVVVTDECARRKKHLPA
jgi:hypothetical protein